MRPISIAIALLFSNLAVAKNQANSLAVWHETLAGQVLISIDGPVAEKLFDHMTDAVEHDLSAPGRRVIQRVGGNISCVKSAPDGGAPYFHCTTGSIGTDGTVGEGAAG